MKVTFDKKIADLQSQISDLERENEEKDVELKSQMAKISEIQQKLKSTPASCLAAELRSSQLRA